MLYETLFRPILFQLDAERAHHLALAGLDAAAIFPGEKILKAIFKFEDPRLSVKAFGLTFPNPIGLAAGFDKDAAHLRGLTALGFGFLEAGTVTFHAQPGNPKPRIRRIPEAYALWNHLGFNNEGAQSMAARLARTRIRIPLGINIGKSGITPVENAVEDYLSSFRILFPYGDYFVLNVSSPNTPGLRALQEGENLERLLSGMRDENRKLAAFHHGDQKPLLVKISPDLSDAAVDALLDTAMRFGVRGIIATNTTLSREKMPPDLPVAGGVSGAPLQQRSTEIIRQIRQRTGGNIDVVGSGGIFSTEDAWEKIRAGASLLQVYTGIIYRGPGLIRELKKGLLDRVERSGASSIREVVGGAG